MEVRDMKDLVKLCLLFIAISLWLHWLWRRRHLYRFALTFPGHFGQPIIGSLLRIKSMENMLNVVSKVFVECKASTVCMWLGIHPHIITMEPKFIEKVLNTNALLNKSHMIYSKLNELFEGGLAFIAVHKWQQHRKLLNPSLHHKVLLSLIPIFNKTKNACIAKLNTQCDGNEHNLTKFLQEQAMALSGATTIGHDIYAENELITLLSQKFSYVLAILPLHITLAAFSLDFVMPAFRKYQNALKCIKDYLRNCVQIQMAELKKSSELIKLNNNNVVVEKVNQKEEEEEDVRKTPGIFIQQAVKLHYSKQFTFDDVVSEANMMVVASFETTATTIFSVLCMLAMHPEIQERVFEEVQSVFPEKEFAVGYEHLAQLPYLEMVINEALRLAPSVPMIGRQVVQDTQISEDIILPAGMEILISIFHLHRRTDIWGADANQFNPDHFLPANLKDKSTYSFIPFSKGIRNCIGWRYAYMSMKTILAGLLRNFRFETSFQFNDLIFLNHFAIRYKEDPLLIIHQRT